MAARAASVYFLSKVRRFSKKLDTIKPRKILNYKIRTFLKEDTSDIVEIAAKSALQICAESLNSWSKYDPEAIYVAVSDSGRVIGQCSGVIFGDDFCFGGTYVVQEEYRHLGIGNELFAACYEHAGNRNKGLNCFAEKQNSYKRLGFTVLDESFSCLEYESKTRLNVESLSDDLPQGVELKTYEECHLDAMSAYDQALTRFDRKIILQANCQEANTKTLVAFENGICVGFGSVKLNIFERAKVGPLYANNAAVAQVMFKRLVEAMPEAKGFQALTISSNLAANEMIRKLGLPIHGNLLRVYTREKLVIDTSKVFCQFDEEFSPF